MALFGDWKKRPRRAPLPRVLPFFLPPLLAQSDPPARSLRAVEVEEAYRHVRNRLNPEFGEKAVLVKLTRSFDF